MGKTNQPNLVDWDKSGHSFETLREKPGRLGNCIGKLPGDFSRTDLFTGSRKTV